MRIGHCPRCGRPYTAGEVTGIGILRPRPESLGGPRMEFGCPGCGHTMVLVPHGLGRYAPPGEPPPPPVPEAERVPPWLRGERPGDDRGGGRERDPAGRHGARRGAPRPGPAPDDAPEERVEIPEPPPRHPAGDAALTPTEALRILGLPPTAAREEIEQAYREKSLTCHPDKVAHLDLEFQELAERKFRRLRMAFDLLTA